MLYKLLSNFILLLGIFYVAFGAARYTYFSDMNYSDRGITESMKLVFAQSLGDISFTDLDEKNYGYLWEMVFGVIFVVAIVMLLFNLLITILMALYDDVLPQVEGEWCRKQALNLFLEEILEGMEEKKNRKLEDETTEGSSCYEESKCEEDDIEMMNIQAKKTPIEVKMNNQGGFWNLKNKIFPSK